MGKIYTIGGIKGGCGKTTVAINLAILFSKEGQEVLLVDADDQESASYFTAIRQQNGKTKYTCVKLSNSALRSEVLKVKKKYDVIIIDSGGRDTTSQRAALSASDVALFPFPPRSLDVWTIEKLNNMVEDIMSINPRLKAISFINKGDSRGKDNDDVIDILKSQKIIHYQHTILHNRKTYANATAEGRGILELKRRDYRAKKELEALYKKVKSL